MAYPRHFERRCQHFDIFSLGRIQRDYRLTFTSTAHWCSMCDDDQFRSWWRRSLQPAQSGPIKNEFLREMDCVHIKSQGSTSLNGKETTCEDIFCVSLCENERFGQVGKRKRRFLFAYMLQGIQVHLLVFYRGRSVRRLV